MKWFVRILSLKPYGAKLLTPSAHYWFSFMALLVMIMALTEGLTWGYISNYLLPGQYSGALSLFIGIVIFTLIWIVDATLVTIDLSQTTSIERKKDNHRLIVTAILKILSNKLGWGAVIRIVVVTLSMMFTAPLLTQVFLSEDIENELNRIEGKSRTSLIKSVNDKYLPTIAEEDKKLDDLNLRLSSEISGNGQSRRYGEGPVAKSIRDHIYQVKNALESLQTARKTEIDFINNSDIKGLSERYGLSLSNNTLANRSKVQETLVKNSAAHRNVEFLARIFLGFIFIALLGLKIFQPRSVHIYLSEHLQDLYTRYLSGEFNSLISPENYPGGSSPMTPYSFQEWIHEAYPGLVEHINRNIIKEREKCIIEEAKKRLGKLEKELIDNLEPSLSNLNNLNKEASVIFDLIFDLEQKKKQLQDDLSYHEDAFDQLENSALPKGTYVTAIKEKCKIKDKIDILKHQFSDLDVKLSSASQKRAALTTKISDSQQELIDNRETLKYVRHKKDDLIRKEIDNCFEFSPKTEEQDILKQAQESLRNKN